MEKNTRKYRKMYILYDISKDFFKIALLFELYL